MNPNSNAQQAIDLTNAGTVLVYECSHNSDRTEGRGFQVKYAWSLSPSTAKRLAHGKGVMGSDAQVTPRFAIRIGNTIYAPVDVTRPTDEDERADELLEKRNQALAKARQAGLTDDEIALLGKGA